MHGSGEYGIILTQMNLRTFAYYGDKIIDKYNVLIANADNHQADLVDLSGATGGNDAAPAEFE